MDALDKAREKLNQFLSGGGAKADPADADDQTEDEKRLVSYVQEKVTEARQHASRVAHEGIWLTNIAYLLGFDSVYYDTGSRTFKTLDGSQEIVRKQTLSVNKILPTIQNRLARLCKNPPKYDVRPNSEANDDKEGARLAMKVLRNVWDTQKIDAKRIELTMWLQQCGHAYVGVHWDPELGDLLPDPATVGADLGEQVQAPGSITPSGLINSDPSQPASAAQKEAQLIYEGDIRVDVVSAFEGFADPLAKNFDELGYFIRAKLRRLEYFKARYPRGALVKPEGNILLSLQYEQRINSLNSAGPMQSGNPQDAVKNAATEITYYEKRSPKYPKGRMVTVANGVLLDDKALPVGEIPYAKFDDVVIAGKYFSEAVITHMRPLQDAYNTNKTKRMRWLELMLAGKWLAARGHGISQEALDDDSGELLEYDPVPNAEAPHALNPPNIPQYAFQESEATDREMSDIAGINEISRGQLPSAGMPALGMQILQEQDETRAGVVIEGNEHSWARVGKLILLHACRFYKTERNLKEQQKDRSYRVSKFTGDQIRNNCDVIVIRGSTLPGSKVLRRQEIVNFWQQGAFGPPQDPNVRFRVMEMLEFGDLPELWHDQALDLAQIDWKIKEVEQGRTPPVHELDNHRLTIEELNRYRKTEKYFRLPTEGALDLITMKTGPSPRDCFDALLEAHIQALMELTNPQHAANEATPPEVQAQAAAGTDPMTNGQADVANAEASLAQASPVSENMG